MRRPDIKLNYILTVPTGFDPAKESLPLVVFLHGAGERGSLPEHVERVKAHGIPKYYAKDPDHAGTRVITLSPQCPDGMVWTNLVCETKALIEEIAEEYNADKARISLTGISMGGFGTWEIAALFPEMFRAIGPVCGGGNPQFASRYTMPVRVFHGDADPVVPFWRSKEMVDAIEAKGGDVLFTVYEGVKHNSWENAYSDENFIKWLAGQ